MSIPNFELPLVRGRTKKFRFQVQSEDTGTAQNTSTWTKFWFTAKVRLTDLDSAALLTLTTTAGIVAVNATTGLYEATVTPAMTLAAPDGLLDLIGEILGQDASGNVWELARGQVQISDQVQVSTA